jgi:serine/threonine protein kinase
LELVYGEFLLREEWGEVPDAEEYVWRFPRCAERLLQQIELYRALGARATHLPAGQRIVVPDGPEGPAEAETGPAARWPDVAGYAILGELGRGGMGVVYKAWQWRLRRVVALKMILHEAWAAPAVLTRFHTEAEAIGRLQHSHVVQVYEVGEHDGRPFLVMEFADGGSLDRKLAGTPLRGQQAAELLEKLARPVHHAHGRGIVHRDLTPATVLLTADGTPKITDFGLAKFVKGGGAGQTPPGAVLGTPSYTAPEQAAGEVRDVGPLADIYSLGAILYETLTGRPPFKSSDLAATLQQALTEEPVPPRRFQPELPRDLETFASNAWRSGRASATPALRTWPTTSAASSTGNRSGPGWWPLGSG